MTTTRQDTLYLIDILQIRKREMAVNVTNSVDDGEEGLDEYDYDYELDESLSTYDWAELGRDSMEFW